MEEKRRIISCVNGVKGVLDIHTICNIFIGGSTLHSYQCMLCIVAIAHCTHVHHVVQNNQTCLTLLLLLTSWELGNLQRRKLQQIFLKVNQLSLPSDMVTVNQERANQIAELSKSCPCGTNH